MPFNCRSDPPVAFPRTRVPDHVDQWMDMAEKTKHSDFYLVFRAPLGHSSWYAGYFSALKTCRPAPAPPPSRSMRNPRRHHDCCQRFKQGFPEFRGVRPSECSSYSRPFFLSHAFATSASDWCSTSTALFMACISPVPRFSARGSRICLISGYLSKISFRTTGAGL